MDTKDTRALGRRGWLTARQRLAVMAAAALSVSATAGLPELAKIMADEGDFIGMIQEYALNIVVLAGLVMSAAVLFVVVKNAIQKYSEVAKGTAGWGDLGMHIAVGVVVIAVVLFLLTLTPAILET